MKLAELAEMKLTFWEFKLSCIPFSGRTLKVVLIIVVYLDSTPVVWFINNAKYTLAYTTYITNVYWNNRNIIKWI